MLTETDGLEKAIQITQRIECPPDPKVGRKNKAFETGFQMARHLILQELREEQNRRFKHYKESNSG